MVDEKTKDRETEVFIDYMPNLIRIGQTKTAEDFLKEKFEKTLPNKITRYGKLPPLNIRLGLFRSLIQEARNLFIDGYHTGAIALCGMTVEALCVTIADERVKDESLKNQLIDPSKDCRKKIKLLKKYFRISKSASWLHKVLDIRKEYLHLHKIRVLSEDVLECIIWVHLAVIAEYGLFPTGGGKVRFATKEDIDQMAKRFGL